MTKDKDKIGSNGRAGKPAVPVVPVASPPGIVVPVEVEDADAVPVARRGAVGSAPGRRMSATETAKRAGISRQRVSILLARGHTPGEIIESSNRRKSAALAAVAEQQADEARTRTGGSTPLLATSLRRKEAALASMRELELAVKRGELVEFAPVQNWSCTAVIAAREVWCRIADLAASIRQCADDISAQRLIDQEVRRGLGELEKFGTLAGVAIAGGALPDAPPAVRAALATVLGWCAASGGAAVAVPAGPVAAVQGAKGGNGGGNGNG